MFLVESGHDNVNFFVGIKCTPTPNQRIPYAITMPPTSKSRIMALPPRIPKATWEAIFGYILEKPADWNNLASDEAILEKILYPGLEDAQ